MNDKVPKNKSLEAATDEKKFINDQGKDLDREKVFEELAKENRSIVLSGVSTLQLGNQRNAKDGAEEKMKSLEAVKRIIELDNTLLVAQALLKAIKDRPTKDMPVNFKVTVNKMQWTIEREYESYKLTKMYSWGRSITGIMKNNPTVIKMILHIYYGKDEKYRWKFAEQIPSASMLEKYQKIFTQELHHELMHAQLIIEKKNTTGVTELGQVYKKIQTDLETSRQAFEAAIKILIDHVNTKFSSNKIDIDKFLGKGGDDDLFEFFLQEKFVFDRMGDLYGIRATNEEIIDAYSDVIFARISELSVLNLSPARLKPNFDGELNKIKEQLIHMYKNVEVSEMLAKLNASSSATSKNVSIRNDLLIEILKGKNQYFTVTQQVDKNGFMEIKVADGLNLTRDQKLNLYTAFIKALTAYVQGKNISGVHVLPLVNNNKASIDAIVLKVELKGSLLSSIKTSMNDTLFPMNSLPDLQEMIATLRPTYTQNIEQRDKLISDILRGENPYFEVKPVNIHGEEGIEVSIKESANLSKEQKQELIVELNKVLPAYQNDKGLLGDIYQYPNKDFSKTLTGDFVKLANGTHDDINNNKTPRLG